MDAKHLDQIWSGIQFNQTLTGMLINAAEEYESFTIKVTQRPDLGIQYNLTGVGLDGSRITHCNVINSKNLDQYR